MRAGIYTRVSTSDQDPAAQLRQLEALCAARGWDVALVAQDTASGAADGRQAFAQFMHEARVGAFNVAVFWAWDRITRRGIGPAMAIMEAWRSWGVRWESLQEPFLSSGTDPEMGKLLLAIIAWVAAQERRRISERTKAGMAQRRALGLHMGRPAGIKETKPRKARRKTGTADAW